MENVIIIAIILILLIIGLRSFIKRAKGESSCCGGSSKPVKKQSKKLKRVVCTKTVIIEGMTCEYCSARIENCISKIDGAVAEVNLRKGKATVSMEHEIPDEKIRETIENAGYTVVEII